MNSKSLACCVALVIVVGMQGTVLAGGGTKSDITVTVKNNTADVAGLIMDTMPDPAWDPATFVAKGGKTPNAGAQVTFKVKAGTHTIYAILAPAGAPNPLSLGSKKFTAAAKGGGITLTVTAQGGVAVIN